MGWLWSSPAPTVESSPAQSLQPSPESTPSRQSTTPLHPSSPLPKRELTRDEIADNEFRSLLEELEADIRPSSTRYNRVPQPSPSRHESPGPPKDSQEVKNLTLEDDLLPKDMSCRQAFDAAFYCQSLGGQFNNVFRYGGIRSCSETWGDFWFCMRTKSYTGEGKEGKILSLSFDDHLR
jgi:hypothetical protein